MFTPQRAAWTESSGQVQHSSTGAEAKNSRPEPFVQSRDVAATLRHMQTDSSSRAHPRAHSHRFTIHGTHICTSTFTQRHSCDTHHLHTHTPSPLMPLGSRRPPSNRRPLGQRTAVADAVQDGVGTDARRCKEVLGTVSGWEALGSRVGLGYSSSPFGMQARAASNPLPRWHFLLTTTAGHTEDTDLPDRPCLATFSSHHETPKERATWSGLSEQKEEDPEDSRVSTERILPRMGCPRVCPSEGRDYSQIC